MKRLFTIVLFISIAFGGYAQERYVTSQVALGHLNQLDTYLSNEKYTGTELEFISEVVRDSHKHPITYTLTHEGALSSTHNRADNGSFLSGHYNFAYAIMREWEIGLYRAQSLGNSKDQTLQKAGLTIRAGGFVNGDLGFCYFTNSAANNPAQGYASMNLGPEVMMTYKFKLLKKMFRLTYEARVPLVGIMFSPNYGQSYYEIFTQNNYDHNIVFTSITTFQLRHQLSLDIPVSKRYALRIGYLGDLRQATPNNLKQHQWYNAALLGIVLSK